MADLASVAKLILTAEDKTGAAFQAVSGGLDGLQGKALGLVTGGLAALGAALTYGAFKSFIDGAIESAAAIQSLHEKTGVGIDALTSLRSAAKLADTDLQSIVPAILKLEQNMVKAAGGSQELSAAFTSLGVDVRESTGALREPDAVLLDLAKKFEDLEDGAAKTGLAMQIFGKQGAAMIPVLHELALQGEYVTKITKQQAEAADDYQKNLVKMDAAANSAKNAIGNALIPAMDAISQVMLETVTQGGGLREMLMNLVADGSIASWAQTGVIWIARVADVIGNVLGLLKGLVLILVDVVKAFGQLDVVTQGMEKIVKGDLAGGMAQIKSGWQGIKDIGSDIATTWEKASTRTTNFEDAATRAILRVSEMGTETGKTAKQVTDFGKATKDFENALDGMNKKLVEANILLAEASDITAEQTSPAMKELLTLVDSDKWGKFNQQQKAAIIDKALDADATWQQAEALKAFNKATADASTYLLAAEQSLAEWGLTADQKTLPAMQKLRDLQDSPAWNKFSDDQKNQKVAMYEAAAAAQQAERDLKALKEQSDAYQHVLDDLDKAEQANIEKLRAKVEALDAANQKIRDETGAIGLCGVELELYNSHLQREKDLQGALSDTARDRINDLYDQRDALIVLKDQAQKTFDGWKDVWSSVADKGASFIEDFVQHGSSAFKNLWADFKTWALEAIAKIAAQQIVVSIAGNFGPVSGAAANSLFGGSLFGGGGGTAGAAGGAGNLLSGASSVNSLFGGGSSSLISSIFGGIGNASAAGPIIPTLGSTFAAGLTSPISTIASFATEGLAAAGGIAGILGAAIPVLGVALAAGSLFGLFGKDSPAQREGTFGSNAGLGAGNPLFQSSSNLGTFGIFDDKWFSDKDQGQAIQQFLAGIAQVDNAIASIIDAPTLERVKANLATATTTFTAGMEHEASTFGDVIKDRYHNVVETIDPELTHLVDGFKGTSDQLGKFVVDILSVAQVLRTIDSEDLFGQIVTVDDIITLQHAGETVSQTFTRVSQEFTLTNAIAETMGQNVSTAFGEMGLASEGARADLIKLMGGMQAAGAAFTNYLNVAFTDAERQAKSTAAATETLVAAFGGTAEAVPKTWEELNKLISSLDLTTEEGRQTYATMLNQVVPAFVAVNGTAEAASKKVEGVAVASTNLATAAASVINPMMGVVQGLTQLRSASSLANDALSGISSQNDTLEQFIGGSDNGSKLSTRLSVITGEIDGLNEQLARYQGGDLSNTDNAFGEIATLLKQIGPLKDAQSDVAASYAHFATLSAQYGGDIANKLFDLEQNYNKAQGTLAGNSAALSLLKTSFDNQWAAIVGNAQDATTVLADSTQTIVEHVLTPLEKSISGLHSAFGNDTALTDAVKWLNGVPSASNTRSDDWQVNLNNALPNGKLVSQEDVAAMTRVLGTLLDRIGQNTDKTGTATTNTASAVQGAPASDRATATL